VSEEVRREKMQCKLTQYVVKRDMKFMTVQESTGEKINSFRKVYELMKPEAAIDRECVWVLHLNSHLELIEKELVSMGDVSASIVHPREVFKKAILHSSSQIVVVHNHPSGDFLPSVEDKDVAKRLYKAGEIIGIPLADFMVISTKGFFSFANEGMLEQQ